MKESKEEFAVRCVYNFMQDYNYFGPSEAADILAQTIKKWIAANEAS